MANYRQIHVSIWKDEWFLDLDPQEKLLFIYLFSNSNTNLAGLYKIPLRVIAFETCLDMDYVADALSKFSRAGKVFYDGGIVWVVNMQRYHSSESPKVKARIANDIASIPECNLKIQYRYSIDTRSHKDKEEDKEEDKDRNTNENNRTTTAIVFQLYESEVGSITKVISDELTEAIDVYPGDWFEPAFKEAARNNKRNWAYVKAILKHWKTDGFQSRNGKGSSKGGKDSRFVKNDPKDYTSGEYAAWLDNAPGEAGENETKE